MPKNIVICCDGTWNSADDEDFGVPAPTNVHRLYQACLDRAESGGQQFVWYQPGVGAWGGKVSRAFEGATGTGISANIRRGYLAIARHYEPGDRIFLFGFSRGAFTARSIAGMMRQVGLLARPTPTTDVTVKMVAQAYDYYRNTPYAREEPRPSPVPDVVPAVEIHPRLHLPTRYVRIQFIGVWDTVGSLGIPLWGQSFNLRLFFRNDFHELSPNEITDYVCHALAIDEMRPSFMPMLWEAKPDEPTPTHIEQAWFRGVHSDVGGGYADRSLGDITYRWLLEHAEAQGLQLRPGVLDSLPPEQPDGRIHRSYVGTLYTTVGGWPRWPPLQRQHDNPPHPHGYMHDSVFAREKKCTNSGSKEKHLYWLKPGETCSVEVPADQLWTNTGLVLEQGATYVLVPAGWWQDLNDEPVGAEGQPPDTESWMKRLLRRQRRVPNQHWMRLIGLVNYPRHWEWREQPLRHVPRTLFEGDSALVKDLFPIDPGQELTIPKPPQAVSGTGLLWVFANDLWQTNANNTGSLVLTVTRKAEGQ